MSRKCEALAQADFEKGTYRLISWGFESPTREMIAPILKEDYNITTLFAGCVRFEGVECYHDKMVTLLTKKYGPGHI